MSTAPESADTQPPVGCLLRLFWLLLGNALLALAAVKVAQSEGPGPADAAYLGLLAALLGARWLDVTRFRGLTTEAVPATPEVLRRYLVTTSVAGLGVWAAARAWAAFG